jgi:signal transduction histidine kinase
VALPLFFDDTRSRRKLVGSVVVFSAPLEDVEGSVDVIRERMLAAALIALLAATIAGLVVARTLARRVKRLEEVAWRVAEGDFGARFPIDSPDELGQLARALGDMQRQLAELDSARKRFIATASHELRTPIFSLGGFVELLEDDDVPEEDRVRFLEQLRVQVDRLGKLATDLLDLSRLEAGSLELRPERTDIGQLARAVTSEFEPGLAGHDSKLEVRLPPDPVSAVCDPERVAQVMRILLDNALTHTPAGTDVVVSVSERGDVVRLGVGDFGPGIHRSMLPRVFEPFVTTDDARGSGLGLAIAHELAERMKGRLVVESQPGRTTFTLELPA